LRLLVWLRLSAMAFLVLGLAACGKPAEAPVPTYSDKPVDRDQRTHYVFAVHPLHNPQLLHQKFQPLMQ